MGCMVSGRSAMRAAMGKMDQNHSEIVKAYEDMFCTVVDTHALGYGFPDLLVAFAGYCCPVEIKTEEGELNAAQRTFHRQWPGPMRIVRAREDAIEHVTEVRKRLRQP